MKKLALILTAFLVSTNLLAMESVDRKAKTQNLFHSSRETLKTVGNVGLSGYLIWNIIKPTQHFANGINRSLKFISKNILKVTEDRKELIYRMVWETMGATAYGLLRSLIQKINNTDENLNDIKTLNRNTLYLKTTINLILSIGCASGIIYPKYVQKIINILKKLGLKQTPRTNRIIYGILGALAAEFGIRTAEGVKILKQTKERQVTF